MSIVVLLNIEGFRRIYHIFSALRSNPSASLRSRQHEWIAVRRVRKSGSMRKVRESFTVDPHSKTRSLENAFTPPIPTSKVFRARPGFWLKRVHHSALLGDMRGKAQRQIEDDPAHRQRHA